MNKTKKSFLKAGAIIAIVMCSLALIFCLFGISIIKNVTMDNLKDAFATMEDTVVIDNGDGSYGVQFYEDGVMYQEIDYENLQVVVDMVKSVISFFLVLVIAGDIATIIMSSFILKDCARRETKKGHIIAELVLSVLFSNMLTVAFMIVALCIKDTKPTLDNINEFVQ